MTTMFYETNFKVLISCGTCEREIEELAIINGERMKARNRWVATRKE